MDDINTLDQIEVVKRDASADDGDILGNLNTLTQVEIVKDDTEPDPPTPPTPPEPTSTDYTANDLTFADTWNEAGTGPNDRVLLMKMGRIVLMKGAVMGSEDLEGNDFHMFTLPSELTPSTTFNLAATSVNDFIVNEAYACASYTLSIQKNGEVHAKKIHAGGSDALSYQARHKLNITAVWYVKE